jgi:hypothetical protein
MHASFSIYRSLRVAVVPRKTRELEGGAGRVIQHSITKMTRRAVKFSGLCNHAQRPVKQLIHGAHDHNSRLLKEGTAAIWVDNYSVQQAVRRSGLRLADAAACAILGVTLPRRLRVWEWPAWEELEEAVPALMTALAATTRAQVLFCRELTQDMPLESLRVPLDVTRDAGAVFDGEWRPLELWTSNVGSTYGLGRLLGFLQVLRDRVEVQTSLPLLCDQNIWWRLQRLYYWSAADDADAAFHRRYGRVTQGFIPVLGCWHVYKHTVYVICRRFCTFLGSLYVHLVPSASGALWLKPKLRTLEELLAAVTQLSQEDLISIEQNPLRIPPHGETEPSRRLRQCTNAQLRQFCTQAVPELVGLGVCARNCTWTSRANTEDSIVREVLERGLVLLCKYGGPTGYYVREASIQLLSLVNSPLAIRPQCWQEESCEALLSRLARNASRSPIPDFTIASLRRKYLCIPETLHNSVHLKQRFVLRDRVRLSRWLEAVLDGIHCGSAGAFRVPDPTAPQPPAVADGHAVPPPKPIRKAATRLEPCSWSSLDPIPIAVEDGEVVKDAVERTIQLVKKPLAGFDRAAFLAGFDAVAVEGVLEEDRAPHVPAPHPPAMGADAVEVPVVHAARRDEVDVDADDEADGAASGRDSPASTASAAESDVAWD